MLNFNMTLENYFFVREVVKKHSADCTRYELWKKVRKHMSYQTFLTFLDYLFYCGLVMFDKNGDVSWVYDKDGEKEQLKGFRNAVKRN
ncbi:hypothetical protein COV93_05655 [Candidatus Woesearchaeota archaeon CG11_big_fil_rev_8_21_14_0_20_43_8]|nr:MAG: hypothetical protein COV93_05655 [Candidatus Woesearchaeota archaeon CG11_big_fil_rev_8_21_14_0_20_43_8]